MFHIKKTCQKILGKDNCSTDENSQIYKAWHFISLMDMPAHTCIQMNVQEYLVNTTKISKQKSWVWFKRQWTLPSTSFPSYWPKLQAAGWWSDNQLQWTRYHIKKTGSQRCWWVRWSFQKWWHLVVNKAANLFKVSLFHQIRKQTYEVYTCLCKNELLSYSTFWKSFNHNNFCC